MNNLQELIYKITISNYQEIISNYTDEQLEFAKGITERLILDKDTNRVNVVPAPCGFGKSVLIRGYLKSVVTMGGFNTTKEEYKGDGFVVITDLLDRFFEGYENDEELNKYCYLMYYEEDGDTFQEQIFEQNKYPVLLMTTQKYFKLKENERDFIFRWKYGQRKTVIFDEKPLFYNVVEIDKEFINDIDNEIDPIIETEDKNFLNNEIKYLRDYLENEKNRLSSKSDDDIICYWQGTRKNIGTDDDRFLTLTNKYLSIESQNKVKLLKEILKDGAMFVNKKNKNSKDNRRMFFTIKDNKDGFYLGKNRAKFWIFDATADVDVEYEKDYIKMIKVNYTKDFPIKIKNINIGTSRNNIKNKEIKLLLNNYLINNYSKDTLIASYQEYIPDIYNFDIKDYFGGMKGTNKYIKCKNIVQIGLNRFSDIGYLQIYLSIHPETYNYIRKNPDKSEGILNNLLKMEYGNFVNEEMNYIMYSKLAVDTEQNIFRTKLRDYSNTDIVEVDLIYNSDTYKELNIILAERFEIDEIKVDEPVEILEYKIINRNNKTDSVAQRIIDWFNVNEGYGAIKTKDLLAQNMITQKQFDKAKENNESFKKWINNKKGNKRGYYVA